MYNSFVKLVRIEFNSRGSKAVSISLARDIMKVSDKISNDLISDTNSF